MSAVYGRYSDAPSDLPPFSDAAHSYNVAQYLRTLDLIELLDELHEVEAEFMAAVRCGDALAVGRMVIKCHRDLAERLALREEQA